MKEQIGLAFYWTLVFIFGAGVLAKLERNSRSRRILKAAEQGQIPHTDWNCPYCGTIMKDVISTKLIGGKQEPFHYKECAWDICISHANSIQYTLNGNAISASTIYTNDIILPLGTKALKDKYDKTVTTSINYGLFWITKTKQYHYNYRGVFVGAITKYKISRRKS